MIEDPELLRRYAFEGSESAFAEFVSRRIGLVYGVALRHTGDAHRSEDVVQRVFIAAACDAKKLSARSALVGWLYRSAQFAAIDAVRAEQRRAARERQANTMEEIERSIAHVDWNELRPVLDDVVNNLEERDRDAILLRFFDEHAFAEIGAQLRMTENAARMRVERALEKMRSALARRGVTSTAAALGLALTNHAAVLPAVPVGLAASATSAALASGVVVMTGGSSTVLGIMSTSKLGMTVAAAIGIAAIGVGLYQTVQHRHTKRALAAAVQQRDELRAKLMAAQARPQAAPLAAHASTQKLAAPEQQTSIPTRPTASRASPAEKLKLHDRYDPFLLKFGLSKEQRERFVELKLAIAEAHEDVQLSVENNQVPGGSPEVAAIRQQLTKPMWDEIKQLLGSDGYAAYGDYEQTSAYRPTVVGLFSPSGMPVSDDQIDQITRLIIRNTQTFRAKPTDVSTRAKTDWNAVARDAEGILTPDQLAILRARAAVLSR